jgi:hypothetical protein
VLQDDVDAGCRDHPEHVGIGQPAETSLTMRAAAAIAACAVLAFIVSMLTRAPSAARPRRPAAHAPAPRRGDAFGARPGRLSADVEDVGAVGAQRQAVRDRGVGREEASAVAEGVGVTLTMPMIAVMWVSRHEHHDLGARRRLGELAARGDRDGRGIRLASPRIVTHSWWAASTTSTPRASRAAAMVSAICSPSRSCTCGRAASTSTTLGSAPRPTTCSPGRYAMCARPAKAAGGARRRSGSGCRAAAPRRRARVGRRPAGDADGVGQRLGGILPTPAKKSA